MATGDLANNLRKLQKELKLIKFSENVDLTGMSQGTPTAFLPIYHYLFTSYSHAIAEMISSSDTELFGKTDFRFIEAVYKIMRDMFSYKPLITKEQFFNAGFAERKIIMCAEVIQMIREKNRSLQPSKKPTTSAVSTISQNFHKKLPRPKTADSMKASLLTASGKHLARRASADQQKQVKFSEEGVINELRQPVKHQTSRHVARKDPPSPVAIVTMSPSVTKETVGMDEHQSRGFKYVVMTPAVAKQPKKSTRSAETAPSKGLQFDEHGSIEVVTATTPDTSLYEPLHNSTSIVHEEMQNQLSTLQHSVEIITGRLSSFESALISVTTTMQNHQSSSDPKLLDIVSHIQQQIENLAARMVLMENRVSIVESKLQQSSPASSLRSSDITAVSNGHREQQTYSTTQVRPSLVQGYPPNQIHPNQEQRHAPTQARQNDVHVCTSTQLRSSEMSEYSPTLVCANEVDGLTTTQVHRNEPSTRNLPSKEINQPPNQGVTVQTVDPVQCESSVKTTADSYSGNTSIPAHVTNSDQFSFALSPIRTIIDSSGFKLGPNATGEDTFALETEDDARRSSTPTDFKDLPLKPTNDESSMSFHFGDVSTQQKVDRIKNLMAATQTMLK